MSEVRQADITAEARREPGHCGGSLKRVSRRYFMIAINASALYCARVRWGRSPGGRSWTGPRRVVRELDLAAQPAGRLMIRTSYRLAGGVSVGYSLSSGTLVAD